MRRVLRVRKVLQASKGRQGLAAAPDQLGRLVILEIKVPRAYPVIRALRGLQATPALPGPVVPQEIEVTLVSQALLAHPVA